MALLKSANKGESEWLQEIKSQNQAQSNTTQTTTTPKTTTTSTTPRKTTPATNKPTSSSSYYGGLSNANIEPEKLYGDLDLMAGIQSRLRTGVPETRKYLTEVDREISNFGVTDFKEYLNTNYRYTTILGDMEKMLEDSDGATERWQRYTDDWVALDNQWADINANLGFSNGTAETPSISNPSFNVPNYDINGGTVPSYNYDYKFSYDPTNPSVLGTTGNIYSYDPTIYNPTEVGAHWPPYNPTYPNTTSITSNSILGTPNTYPGSNLGTLGGKYGTSTFSSSTYGIGSIGASNLTSSSVLGTPSSFKGTGVGGTTAGGSAYDTSASGKNKLASSLLNGAAKLAGNIIPTLNSKEAKAVMAGGAAAAGVGLAGAAIGGGMLVGGKKKYYIFVPEDFEKLDEQVQEQILADLKAAGFNSERIEIFKNATFRISASELDAHVKKVEKAYELNEEFRKEFLEMYKFDLFDENDNLLKYMLFIAMIIDGSNKVDETNLYNIINPSLEEQEIDFIYSGLVMEEYIYENDLEEESEEDSEEDEDVVINPSRNADLNHAAEWLKEIENQ